MSDVHSGSMQHTMLGRGVEFDMIRQLTARWGDAARGLGDDAAVLDIPVGEQVVVSIDTNVDEVHFKREWLTSREIGFRCAMAAISDVAAMGARPLGMMLAVAFPPPWSGELDAFADGVGEAARAAGSPVLGGDLSRAQTLHCTFTVLGATARPVRRSGARPGDLVYVTGLLGGPAGALAAFAAGREPPPAHRDRFVRPVARVREGVWAAEHGASAMIDLSDGLVSDAEHVATASDVCLTIDLDRLPVMHGCDARAAARSGEEYELLFTVPVPLDADHFARTFNLPLSAIGTVSGGTEKGTVAFMSGAARVDLEKGYDHFSR